MLLPNPARLVQPAAAPCHRVAQVVGGISSPALFPQCPSPLRPGTAGSAAAGLAPCPLPAPSLARRWLTHLPSRSTLSARQPQLFPHFMVCFFFVAMTRSLQQPGHTGQGWLCAFLPFLPPHSIPQTMRCCATGGAGGMSPLGPCCLSVPRPLCLCSVLAAPGLLPHNELRESACVFV